MTGAVATKQASVTTCKCCLSIFTKIKLLIKNRDSSMVFVISAFVIYSDVFHRIICSVENLFIFAICVLSDSSKTLCSYSFYTAVVIYSLYEPYLLLTNSSFILILSEPQRGCLYFGSNLSRFRSKYLEAS